MLDEATIRRQLAEYRRRLDRIDDERTALTDVVKSLESLLKAVGEPDHVSDGPITFPTIRRNAGSKPVGTVSMRSAVARVVRSAGRPMHTREIMAEAQKLGASTEAKVPLSVVDLVLLNLAKKGKVERVAPRTWVWSETETQTK